MEKYKIFRAQWQGVFPLRSRLKWMSVFEPVTLRQQAGVPTQLYFYE